MTVDIVTIWSFVFYNIIRILVKNKEINVKRKVNIIEDLKRYEC